MNDPFDLERTSFYYFFCSLDTLTCVVSSLFPINSKTPMFIQILITVGISQALVLSLLLSLKKNRKTADIVLALELSLMFVIAILYCYSNELMQYFPTLPIHAYVLGYLGAFLFYLYVRAKLENRFEWKWKKFGVHLLPFALAYVVLAVNLYPLSIAERLATCKGIMMNDHPFWFDAIYYGLFFGVFPFYLLKTYQLLRQHDEYILTKFSYIEDVRLEWLNRFFWVELAAWSAFVLFEVMGNYWFSLLPTTGMQMSFMVLMLGIFYLGIYGLREHSVFVDAPLEVQEEITSSATGLPQDKADAYLDKLRQFMLQEKPYLEPKITIAELSHRTEIPINHLSRVINDQLGLNFFDFINSYRVEEFKQLVFDNRFDHFTLLGLAFEAGFNSKSTFNAIFKKFTQQTPSEYVRQLRQFPIAGRNLS